MRLFVTGRSLLTPLDAPGQSTLHAILAGRSLADRGIIDECFLVAPGTPIAATLANPQLDKSIRMALLVAHRAIAAANWTDAALHDSETALFAGTSKGPILSWLAAADQLSATGHIHPDLARQIAGGPGIMAETVARTLGITGQTHTSVAACSSGMHALHRAARAVSTGECRRAIVVASDASIHTLFEASFARLGVLAPPDADGHRRCRPFDAEGRGFFLTEAAAAMVLETTPRVGSIELEQTWIGADATHLLAIDPAARALSRGLRLALKTPVSFIHAHATGTSHDAHELGAIGALAAGAPVVSHKRWLGHSLGAAGLAGVVLSADCHAAGLTLDGQRIVRPARSLSISQGFGGHIGLAVLNDRG